MDMEKFVAEIKLVQVGNADQLDEKKYESLLYFLEKYVIKLYGVHRIRAWLGKHKGKTFLDMVTMSDLSYVTSVLENKLHVWEQDYEIRDLSKADKDKFKLHVWKGLSSEEQEEYRKVQPKFSNSSGQKKRYLSHGWNKAGLDFYNKGVRMWKSFSSDREKWQGFEVLWGDYVQEHGFLGGEYRKTSRDKANSYDHVRGEGGKGGGDEDFELVLPDDEGFDDGRMWKMEEMPLVHLGPGQGENDDDHQADEDSDEEGHGKDGEEDTPLKGKALDKRFRGETSPQSDGTSPGDDSPTPPSKKSRQNTAAVTVSAKQGGRSMFNDENTVNAAHALTQMGSPSSRRRGGVAVERSRGNKLAPGRTYINMKGQLRAEEDIEDELEEARMGRRRRGGGGGGKAGRAKELNFHGC